MFLKIGHPPLGSFVKRNDSQISWGLFLGGRKIQEPCGFFLPFWLHYEMLQTRGLSEGVHRCFFPSQLKMAGPQAQVGLGRGDGLGFSSVEEPTDLALCKRGAILFLFVSPPGCPVGLSSHPLPRQL